jgi:S1-C subfamily serine protease
MGSRDLFRALLVCGVTCPPALAQIPGKRPDSGRPSEALVGERCTMAVVHHKIGTRGNRTPVAVGTAFVVNPLGYLATNAHVVRAGVTEELGLGYVFLTYPAKYSDERFQRMPSSVAWITLAARVVEIDDRSDTALLELMDKNNPPDCRPKLRLGPVFPTEVVFFYRLSVEQRRSFHRSCAHCNRVDGAVQGTS